MLSAISGIQEKFTMTNRFSLDTEQNPLMRRKEELLNNGETFWDLSEANPARAHFPHIESLIAAAVRQDDFIAGISGYSPHPQGGISAREAISRYYAQAGIPIMPEDIFLTASTSEAYSFLFKLLTSPGEKVLSPSPGYPLVEMLSRMEAAEVEFYFLENPITAENIPYSMDMENLEDSLHPDTRGVVFINPNNPTGNYLSPMEAHRIAEILKERKIPAIVDEVFFDYILPEEKASAEEGRKILSMADGFILNGFSKMLLLPQIKMGWIALTGSEAWKTSVREPLSFLLDLYLSVSAPAMAMAPFLLENRRAFQNPMQERIRANLEWLSGMPVEVFPYRGGWNAIIRISSTLSMEDTEEFSLKLLDEKKVFLMPGYFFDIPHPGAFVVSLILPLEIFREAWKRIQLFTNR